MSSCPSVRLRGGGGGGGGEGANLRNAPVNVFLFWHEASLG